MCVCVTCFLIYIYIFKHIHIIYICMYVGWCIYIYILLILKQIFQLTSQRSEHSCRPDTQKASLNSSAAALAPSAVSARRASSATSAVKLNKVARRMLRQPAWRGFCQSWALLFWEASFLSGVLLVMFASLDSRLHQYLCANWCTNVERT